jgi:hypothetical protein
MAYQDDILERLAEMTKQKGHLQEDYTIGDLSSIMISPNEISNVLYATNAYVTSIRGVKPSADFSFTKEMLESEKR